MQPVTFKAGEMEGAVERLVTKQNGEPKTIQDVIDLLLAVHHDAKSRDNSIVEYLQASGGAMQEYVERIKSLEYNQSLCSDRVGKLIEEERALIEEEHTAFHNAHVAEHHAIPSRRATDANGEDHTQDRELTGDSIFGEIKYTYTFFKWVLAALLSVAITIGVVEFVEHVMH